MKASKLVKRIWWASRWQGCRLKNGSPLPCRMLRLHYACMKRYVPNSPLGLGHGVTTAAIALCLGIALQLGQTYLGLTAGLCAIWLFITLVRWNTWMGHFWLTYVILLVPFVISNGILTGIQFWEYPLIHDSPRPSRITLFGTTMLKILDGDCWPCRSMTCWIALDRNQCEFVRGVFSARSNNPSSQRLSPKVAVTGR